jgi:hypothetical protein
VICAELLTPDRRHGLVLSIFLKAEIMQCRRFGHDEDCSWKQYLADALQNKAAWEEIVLAVRDVLRRLDFKTVWQSKNLEELAGCLVGRLEEIEG